MQLVRLFWMGRRHPAWCADRKTHQTGIPLQGNIALSIFRFQLCKLQDLRCDDIKHYVPVPYPSYGRVSLGSLS
jgi:hypothetical protein